MKNKYFTMAGLLFCGLVGFAQHLECGNVHVPLSEERARIARLQTVRKKAGFKKQAVGDITYVAVKMHLFGNNDGTGYMDRNEANNALAILNREYIQFNVQFYFSGDDFSYINSTAVNRGEHGNGIVNSIHSRFGATDAVNIYVTDVVTIDGRQVGGWAYLTPWLQEYNMIYLVEGQVNSWDAKTTLHEMGHYFGLDHTFNNSDSEMIEERELVTRNFVEEDGRVPANCEMAGDYVCDTPADPYGLQQAQVQDCIYVGSVTDFNGDIYDPQVTNIMSYYWCLPNLFTPGQIERMTQGTEIVTNAEDFTLDAPETPQAAPGAITAVNSDGDYFGDVVVSWTDNSEVETGFIIERSTSPDGGFKAIGGVGPDIVSYHDGNTLPSVTYYYRVKASNTKETYSAVSAPVVTPVTCANTNGQTCELNNNPDGAAWYIEHVSLQAGENTVVNDSECSENGISNNFHTHSLAIAPNDVVNFNVRTKIGEGGTGFSIVASVYADWNRDGDFEDEGEKVFDSESASFREVSGSFTVPANIPVGDIRLRVMASAGESIPGPCTLNWGEIEDYKLTNTTLGINGNEGKDFTVYPNPAKDVLTVQLPQSVQLKAIIITDMTGKKVVHSEGDATTVGVKTLSNGLYLISVITNAGTVTGKFVKQ